MTHKLMMDYSVLCVSQRPVIVQFIIVHRHCLGGCSLHILYFTMHCVPDIIMYCVLTHTHMLFLWLMGTLHWRNVFYTVQTTFSIAL